ncbi:MAG: P-type conjugative transfer protein TrbJ [Caulobacteraceae bacterium]|nr:P-type conjugative transfer protein TrbJ [Caulobacteraceae bacterium]
MIARERLRAAAAALALALALSPVATAPAAAQLTVFDPSNYAQNLLTAARSLQQINNQLQMLTNQTQMLANQAKNLANLPASTLNQLQASITRTETLLGQAQTIAFNVQAVEQAYSANYGQAPSAASDTALMALAQTRWQTSVGAFEDSLKVQAGAVGNIPTNASAMNTLVSASQSASGALQAAQAGNQLLALQVQEISDLIAVLAAKGRADALEQARAAAAESQGQQQYQTFRAQSGYVPGTVAMFGPN